MTTLRRSVQHPLISGSVALMGARLVSMVAGLATFSIVVRSLDDSSFGFWSALVSLTTLTAGLDLGIGNAVRNRIALLRATGDEGGAGEVFGAALSIVVLLSAFLTGLVLAGFAAAHAAGWVEWSADQYRAINIAVVLLGLFQVGNLGQFALYAGGQPVLVAAIEVSRWVISVPALLIVTMVGGGLFPMTAAYFLALALSVMATYPLLLSTGDWPRRLPGPRRAWRIARRDLWAGLGFAALQVAATLVYQTDVLIATQLTSLATAGDFALVQRLYLVPLSLLFAAVTPLWARTSGEVARDNQQWVRSMVERAALFAVAALMVCGIVIVGLGPWAVRVWSGRSIDHQWLYIGLAVWMVVAGWVAVFSVILNGMERVWSQVRYLGVALVVKLLVAALLGERLGIAALAWGAALALLPLALSNWREVRRSLEEGDRLVAGEATA